jgi:hypothetical protein
MQSSQRIVGSLVGKEMKTRQTLLLFSMLAEFWRSFHLERICEKNEFVTHPFI